MAAAALETINSICKNKDIYLVLSEDPEVFGEYGDVFTDLKDYYNKYRSVPSIDILQKINPDVEPVDTDAETKFYVERMKSEFVEGQINNLILKTGKFIQNGHPALTVLDGLQRQVAKLARLSTIVQDINIMDIDQAEEHYAKVREIADENGGAIGIPTGFKGIDSAYTTGMAPGHLIYAMGFSGAGKTWFAALMAIRAWLHGVKPMIVSLEMTPPDMRNRIFTMAGEGMFKNTDLSRGHYAQTAMDNLRKAASDKSEFIVVGGTAGQDVTPNLVQAKIDQHHPGLIVLDYQQLMMDNEKNSSIVPRMTNLSRELKLLSVNNNIPVIVISSVTDNDQGRNRPPTIDQIAWGRAMEYSADVVFAVHRDGDGLTEVVGRKNRFGDLWDMFLRTDYNSGIFEEVFDADYSDDQEIPDSGAYEGREYSSVS